MSSFSDFLVSQPSVCEGGWRHRASGFIVSRTDGRGPGLLPPPPFTFSSFTAQHILGKVVPCLLGTAGVLSGPRLRGRCRRAEISCRNCRIHPGLRRMVTLMLQHLPGLVQRQYTSTKTFVLWKRRMSFLLEYSSRCQSENWRGSSCSFLKEAGHC